MKQKDIDRFNSKIAKSDGCWNWGGSFFANGYGQFFLSCEGKEKNVKANRMAWRIFVGEIPAGAFVLHKCHNRKCVKPDHLYLGDHAQNMRDKVESGRAPKGKDHYKFFLDEDKIKKVKALRSVGLSIKCIKTLLQMSGNSIYRAINAEPRGPFVYGAYA